MIYGEEKNERRRRRADAREAQDRSLRLLEGGASRAKEEASGDAPSTEKSILKRIQNFLLILFSPPQNDPKTQRTLSRALSKLPRSVSGAAAVAAASLAAASEKEEEEERAASPPAAVFVVAAFDGASAAEGRNPLLFSSSSRRVTDPGWPLETGGAALKTRETAEEDAKLAAFRSLFENSERAAAKAAEVEAGAALALASGAVRALFVRAERASVAAEAARLRASLPLEAAARAFFKRSFVFRAERAAKRHFVCSARLHAAAEREVNAELALSSVRGLFAKRVTFAAEPAPLRSPRALAAAKREFAERASAVRAERAAEEERRLVSVARRFFSHCSKLLAKNPNATMLFEW